MQIKGLLWSYYWGKLEEANKIQLSDKVTQKHLISNAGSQTHAMKGKMVNLWVSQAG